MTTDDGHVSEGSAENLFMVKSGRPVTPPVTDDILEGITRAAMIELATREHDLYFNVVRGRVPQYRSWCTPVYTAAAERARQVEKLAAAP